MKKNPLKFEYDILIPTFVLLIILMLLNHPKHEQTQLKVNCKTRQVTWGFV